MVKLLILITGLLKNSHDYYYFLMCVCICVCVLSCVRLFATLWTVAHQAPLSMGFSRREYWSVLPFPSPGESSQPRNQTGVSYIAGGFSTF